MRFVGSRVAGLSGSKSQQTDQIQVYLIHVFAITSSPCRQRLCLDICPSPHFAYNQTHPGSLAEVENE